jgi:hypothetical protein
MGSKAAKPRILSAAYGEGGMREGASERVREERGDREERGEGLR